MSLDANFFLSNQPCAQISMYKSTIEQTEDALAQAKQTVATLEDQLQHGQYTREEMGTELNNYKDRYNKVVSQLQKLEGTSATSIQALEQQVSEARHRVIELYEYDELLCKQTRCTNL